MELIMSATLGEEWRQYFDMVFCNSKKPAFFSAKNPCYELDASSASHKGTEIKSGADLSKNSQKTYFEGNCSLILDFYKSQNGGRSPRAVYFGDQYVSDVRAASQAEGWESIAILEELTNYTQEFAEIEKNSPLPSIPCELTPTQAYWGQDHFIHDRSNPKKNYFVD